MSDLMLRMGALIGTYLLGLLVLLLAVWAGRRLGSWQRKRSAGAATVPLLTLQGSALALLGLMMGFTFSAAVNRFDARKAVVLQEANAVGTAYLRTDFLPAPFNREAAGLLKEYLALRIAPSDSRLNTPEVTARIAQSARLLDKSWKVAVAATKAAPDSRAVGLYSQALNDVIDLHTIRLTTVRNHIPTEWLVVLCLLATISIGLVAYDATMEGKRGLAALVVTSVLTAGVMAVIIDMDHPWLGFLSIDQTPLRETLRGMTQPAP